MRSLVLVSLLASCGSAPDPVAESGSELVASDCTRSELTSKASIGSLSCNADEKLRSFDCSGAETIRLENAVACSTYEPPLRIRIVCCR